MYASSDCSQNVQGMGGKCHRVVLFCFFKLSQMEGQNLNTKYCRYFYENCEEAVPVESNKFFLLVPHTVLFLGIKDSNMK